MRDRPLKFKKSLNLARQFPQGQELIYLLKALAADQYFKARDKTLTPIIFTKVKIKWVCIAQW